MVLPRQTSGWRSNLKLDFANSGPGSNVAPTRTGLPVCSAPTFLMMAVMRFSQP